MDWTSVKEKLPKPGEPVLVLIEADNNYLQFNNMQVAYLSAAAWVSKDAIIENVSHWIYLPSPPKNEHFEAIKGAADSVVGQQVPADPTAREFSFNIIVEGVSYTAYYQKDADGYWEFIGYQHQQL